MKTVTFNPLTHKVVSIEPTAKMMMPVVYHAVTQGIDWTEGVRLAIASAPEYPADAGWISVDERLPEMFQPVLGSMVPTFSDKRLSPVILRYANSYKKKGGNCFLLDGEDLADGVVTHWMPLPPTPEGV